MIAVVLLAIATFIYFFIVKSNKYWSKRNVKTSKVVPIFGDSLWLFLGKESSPERILRLYNYDKNERFIGTYDYQAPVLLLRSPELVKQICVKDFDHFLDHKEEFPGDSLWTIGLVGLRGEDWKNMRSALSPSFTSSKMKAMFTLICNNADSFVQFFHKKPEDTIEVEFRDAFTRYTNDVIANTAFGIQIDSLRNRENEFYETGKIVTDFSSTSKILAFLLMEISPKLANFLDISIFGNQQKKFFVDLIKNNIKMREAKNINRPDMLGLLLQARKAEEKKTTENGVHAKAKKIQLSDLNIAAQMFVFFFGGFDTVSSALCFLAYELAVNPEIQKKLIEEIDAVKSKNWPPAYETVMTLTYLDMVVSEVLRKWPPGVLTERIVTKPYTIKPELPHESPLHLEMGINVAIPIYGFHHDPQYYSDPGKFDPERFSPENKNQIDPYTYLPFGIGPRNCVASRFALMDIKALFFYLLSNFEIIPSENTNIPLKCSKSMFNLDSVNGFPLCLKNRNL